MNPINKETMSDLDNISKKLDKINNIINADTKCSNDTIVCLNFG